MPAINNKDWIITTDPWLGDIFDNSPLLPTEHSLVKIHGMIYRLEFMFDCDSKQVKITRKWIKEMQQQETNDVFGTTAEEVIDWLKNNWEYADMGIKTKVQDELFFLEIHTLGWSENEEILDKFMQSMFWVLFWTKSERGGHYYFEIPKDCLTEKLWKN